MPKELKKFEIIGVFFVSAMSVFLSNLYELSGYSLVGILFGSANNSIWESLKAMVLPFAVWAIIEMMIIHPRLHKLAVVKVIMLYAVSALYILLSIVVSSVMSEKNLIVQLILTAVCSAVGAIFTYKLYFSWFELEKLFAPFVFLLLLFFAFYFSFTPFPPHIKIFFDPSAGLYGIIPKYIDKGATALDTIYFL